MTLPSLAGLTIAEVLALCHAQPADLVLIDEPPGRLQAIEIECRAPDCAGRFVLDIAGGTPLFSVERRWPEAEVLRRTVRRVARPGQGWLP